MEKWLKIAKNWLNIRDLRPRKPPETDFHENRRQKFFWVHKGGPLPNPKNEKNKVVRIWFFWALSTSAMWEELKKLEIFEIGKFFAELRGGGGLKDKTQKFFRPILISNAQKIIKKLS